MYVYCDVDGMRYKICEMCVVVDVCGLWGLVDSGCSVVRIGLGFGKILWDWGCFLG